MALLLGVVGISLFISSLCSILEAVLLSVTHSYVEVLKDQGAKAGHHLHTMKQKIDEPIAAILTLNTIAHTSGAVLGGAIAAQLFGDVWIVVFTVVLTLVILVFSEIIPKTIGATYWKQLGKPSAHVLWWMVIFMKPILIPLNVFTQLLRRKKGPTVTRAELEVLAEIGYSEGTIDEDEWQVVTNVIRLGEITVGEVMTPRTDMIAIPLDSTVERAMEVMLEEGHLRVPVYAESIDKIQGLLLARDLWKAHSDGITEISGIVRPVQFLPTTKLVEDLIPEMRVRRTKMAIVIDEFGGTAGLVTLEDLIEEIVGEIQDEHEEDEPLNFEDLDDGNVRIWGGVAVREVNDRLDLSVPEEPHDTLGGHVFGVLNRVGRVGDVVELEEGGHLRITQMRGRRVEYLVLVRDAPLTDEPDTA